MSNPHLGNRESYLKTPTALYRVGSAQTLNHNPIAGDIERQVQPRCDCWQRHTHQNTPQRDRCMLSSERIQ